MTDILDLIRKDINATDRNSWSGEIAGSKVTLYAKPMTPEHTKYLRQNGVGDFMSNPSAEGMAMLIARFAENEDGSFAFPKPAVATAVIHRWGVTRCAEIFGELFDMEMEPNIDEDEVGNSQADSRKT